jgi:hypothetical protein
MRLVHYGARLVYVSKQRCSCLDLLGLLAALHALNESWNGGTIQQSETAALQKVGACIEDVGVGVFNFLQEFSLGKSAFCNCVEK